MNAPTLRIVASSSLPDPPYPPDVRARGWPFDLDLERVHQSMTWKRCPPDYRPWLYMTWAEAWVQSPVGTLPAEDDDIAVIIGMQAATFALAKTYLLAGWVKHSDGRLYHRVLTEKVLTMMGNRRRDADRKSLAKKHSDGFQRIPTDSAAASASASASAKVKYVARATRVPTDVPDEWLEWAVKVHQCDRRKAIDLWLEFHDYWVALPGARGCKLDWFATWKNNVRKKVLRR